jgi:holo-[acyl-carrier protein] synthase
MILGIGIDIVNMHGMETSLLETGFQQKVFTNAELEAVKQYRSKTEHLAGKFAAKEAFMKALGAGIRQEVWFTQIEVLNDETGKPCIRTSGNAEKRWQERGAAQAHVSISHSAGVAVAVVILEG